MSIRIPRFRLRTMVILVALTGSLMGLRVALERRRGYRRLREQYSGESRFHQNMAHSLRRSSDMLKRMASHQDNPNREIQAKAAIIDIAVAEYHDAMSRKYRQAARSPWLAVPPDPPEPPRYNPEDVVPLPPGVVGDVGGPPPLAPPSDDPPQARIPSTTSP
jgi:hypothetical protein